MSDNTFLALAIVGYLAGQLTYAAALWALDRLRNRR